MNKVTIDKEYGSLLVKRQLQSNSRGEKIWECECKCGKLHNVTSHRLISGQTQSCGCKPTGPKRDDSVIGQRFNHITVLSFHSMGTGRSAKYNVQCDCGKIFIKFKNSLKKCKSCKKCGYKAKEKVCGELPNWYFNSLKVQAKSRKLEFNLTIEYLNNLFLKQNRKCAYSNRDLIFTKYNESSMTTASLDRIDSNKGYIEGNVQWVYKVINYMKSNLPHEEFISICKEIAICQNEKH